MIAWDHLQQRLGEPFGDECVLWDRSVNTRGYGQVHLNGKNRQVHVVTCEMFHGKRPKGMQVGHSCHVRRCFNPHHLRWVTPTENQRDRISNGTRNSHLTEDDIREIRSLGGSHAHVARLFCVTPVTIASIRRRDTWGWVSPGP